MPESDDWRDAYISLIVGQEQLEKCHDNEIPERVVKRFWAQVLNWNARNK